MSGIYDMDDDAFVKLRQTTAELCSRSVAPIPELKLTRGQLDEIRKTIPTVTGPDATVTAMFGVPIVIVETLEESTPFTAAWDSLVRRLEGRR